MMPLSMSNTGTQARVCQVRGAEETRRLLENMGFVAGSIVTVVTEINGNLIVNVKDTRVAISRALASKILVQ